MRWLVKVASFFLVTHKNFMSPMSPMSIFWGGLNKQTKKTAKKNQTLTKTHEQHKLLNAKQCQAANFSMTRKSCSVSATSDNRILPSSARSFKAWQFVTVSFPSSFRRCFSFLQYAAESLLSVSTPHTSTIEKYHFSCSLSPILTFAEFEF